MKKRIESNLIIKKGFIHLELNHHHRDERVSLTTISLNRELFNRQKLFETKHDEKEVRPSLRSKRRDTSQ